MCSPQKVWRLINLHQVSSNKSNTFFHLLFLTFLATRHNLHFAIYNVRFDHITTRIRFHYNISCTKSELNRKQHLKTRKITKKKSVTIFRKTRFYITKFLPYPYTAMILLVGIGSHTTFIGFFQNIFWRRPIIFS